MRFLILLLLSIGVYESIAQDKLSDQLRKNFEVVDFDQISEEISYVGSKNYYPDLYTRYVMGDTTLNLHQYRLLYYGYAFQESYAPLDNSPIKDSISVHLEKYGEKMEQEQSLQLVDLIRKALVQEPFNLRLLNLLGYAYQQTGDIQNALISARNLNAITEVILSSGSGIDKEYPWVLLYRKDLYDLMTMLGGTPSRRIYITTTVEYYHLKEKINDVRGFYFDLSKIYSKGGKDDGKRKFEFNPQYNPKSKQFINKNLNLK